MAGNSQKLIAFNYFGGKFSIVERLYSYFPPHSHFIDVFCGSMVVTLNKKPSQIDTANDINRNVFNFFNVLRNHPDELLRELFLTPVSRDEYNQSWDLSNCSDIERARRWYVRVRQSFYGLGGQRKNKGWHLTIKNSRASVAETVSKWNNGIEKLMPVINRLRTIQFENRDFRELLPKLNDKQNFFYCDPPYPNESRSSKNDYAHDFSDQDHHDLAELLHHTSAKVMISGYECDLMNRLYSDWAMVKLGSNLIISGKKKVECIWMNYPSHELKQTNLFC